MYYQALLGARRFKEAASLAERILEFDAGASTYNELAWNGYLTGAPVKANLEQARRANEMTQGTDAAIVDTLARLLHAMGQRKEALALLDDALDKISGSRDRQGLIMCKHELMHQE